MDHPHVATYQAILSMNVCIFCLQCCLLHRLQPMIFHYHVAATLPYPCFGSLHSLWASIWVHFTWIRLLWKRFRFHLCFFLYIFRIYLLFMDLSCSVFVAFNLYGYCLQEARIPFRSLVWIEFIHFFYIPAIVWIFAFIWKNVRKEIRIKIANFKHLINRNK